MKSLLALGLVLVIATGASSEEFTGVVTSVHDGDTCRVKKEDGNEVRIRFIYCDTPEIDQPHGIQARDFVDELCLDKEVTVRSHGTDDYGRVLGEVVLEDGTSVNKKVIEDGHGWWFYHYHEDEDDPELGHLEVEAKLHKRGLFAAEAPIYPRAWRRGARLNGQGGGDEGGDSDGVTGGDTASPASAVFILALLPNPDGDDDNNETVILANSSNLEVSIDQWRLEDDDNGVFTLSGTVPAGGSRTVRLNASLLLGNSGDQVRLRKPNGDVVQTVGYGNGASGRFIIAR